MKQPQQITPVGAKITFVEVWKWGQELERLRARIAPRFVRPEPRRWVLAYLDVPARPSDRCTDQVLDERASFPPGSPP